MHLGAAEQARRRPRALRPRPGRRPSSVRLAGGQVRGSACFASSSNGPAPRLGSGWDQSSRSRSRILSGSAARAAAISRRQASLSLGRALRRDVAQSSRAAARARRNARRPGPDPGRGGLRAQRVDVEPGLAERRRVGRVAGRAVGVVGLGRTDVDHRLRAASRRPGRLGRLPDLLLERLHLLGAIGPSTSGPSRSPARSAAATAACHFAGSPSGSAAAWPRSSAHLAQRQLPAAPPAACRCCQYTAAPPPPTAISATTAAARASASLRRFRSSSARASASTRASSACRSRSCTPAR